MLTPKMTSPIELIKKSIQIFFKKENLIYLSKIYLVLVPFSIFSLFQGYLVNPDTLQPKNVSFTVLIIAVNLVYVFLSVLVGATVIEAIRRIVNNEKLVVKSAFQVGWKKYWSYLMLSILLALIIGFGFVLLIIPGILFAVWYSFSRFILIESDKTGVVATLGKSKKLVQGRFWKVFGRLLTFGIFSAVVVLLVSLIPYGIGSVLGVFLEALFIIPSYLLYKELIN